MGKKAIGIDIVPNPPLVVKGDFNNLKYKDKKFDMVYTNAFDHAWDPDIFFKNVYRVLKDDGLFVIDVFPGEGNFSGYEVIFVEKAEDVKDFLVKSGKFECVGVYKKLPRLMRKHTEVQLVLKKV